jgi:membrane protease YdiL (CAAX protease family)
MRLFSTPSISYFDAPAGTPYNQAAWSVLAFSAVRTLRRRCVQQRSLVSLQEKRKGDPVAWGLKDMLWASLTAIALVLAGLIALIIFLALFQALRGSPLDQKVWIWGVLALESILVVPAWFWGPRKYGQGWASLGLHAFPVVKTLVLALISLPLMLLINAGWELVRRQLGWAGQPNYLPLFGGGPLGLALALLIGGVIAPIAEEIFFRGYLYAGLRSRLGLGWGLVLSALLFAVLHVIPGVIPPIFLLGLILATVYEYSGSLWPAILLHSAINTLAFVAAYLTG